MAGLWTPVTGIIVSAVQGWIAFSLPNGALMPIVLAVLGLSLAMIGPGAWSIDGRLFRRKQITTDSRRSPVALRRKWYHPLSR